MSERFNNVFKRLKNNWAISVDTVRSRSKKYNRKEVRNQEFLLLYLKQKENLSLNQVIILKILII